jgi:hypothetical protein
MVHMDEMRDFMRREIVKDIWRGQYESPGETKPTR